MDSCQKTKYQQTHYPIKKLEVLCVSRSPLNAQGFCPDCGRHLVRGGRAHKPDQNGAFGWIERYADGSFWVTPGPRPMPWCKVCEQSNVPAVHTTPLGEVCCGPVFHEAPQAMSVRPAQER